MRKEKKKKKKHPRLVKFKYHRLDMAPSSKVLSFLRKARPAHLGRFI
jgi:hypothetical protein